MEQLTFLKRGLVFHGMGFDKGKRFRANRGERWMIRGAVYQNGAGQGRYRLLCAVCDMTGEVARRLAPRCPAVCPAVLVIPADAGIQGGGAAVPPCCCLSYPARHSCGRRNPGCGLTIPPPVILPVFTGMTGLGVCGHQAPAKPVAGRAVIMIWHGAEPIRRKPAVSGSWHANTFRDCLDR